MVLFLPLYYNKTLYWFPSISTPTTQVKLYDKSVVAHTEKSYENDAEDNAFYDPAVNLAEIPTDPFNHDIELQKTSMYDSKELSVEDPNFCLNLYSLDD